MNKIMGTVLLGIFLISCGKVENDHTMTVSGRVKGLKKGTLYLQHIPDSVLVTVDSVRIDGDDAFSFQTDIESPEIFYLYLNKKDNNDINDRITFFGEPGTITINTSWNTFDTQARVTGSKSHEKLEEYRQVMSKFNTRNMEIIRSAYDPEIQKDSIMMDSIRKASDKNLLRGYLYALNFALNNKDSYVAPYIALNEVADVNVKYLDSIYNSLTPEVSASKYGMALRDYLIQLKK